MRHDSLVPLLLAFVLLIAGGMITVAAYAIINEKPKHCIEVAVFCAEFEGGECPIPHADGPLGGYVFVDLCGDLRTPTGDSE